MKRIKIPTTCWSDATKGQGNLPSAIQALDPTTYLEGPAYPVQLVKGDNLDLIEAILQAPAGSVLVVNTAKNTATAIIGDNYAAAAKALGIAGIVTDGLVRDYQEIIDLNFPIFCIGHCTRSPKKQGGGQQNRTIVIGDIDVHPGDYIVGDRNGVMVIPSDQVETVREQAQLKDQRDEATSQRIQDNPQAAQAYLEELVAKFRQ